MHRVAGKVGLRLQLPLSYVTIHRQARLVRRAKSKTKAKAKAKAKSKSSRWAPEPPREIPASVGDYPIIRATDFVRLVDRYNFWQFFFGQDDFNAGCKMMANFWDDYRRMYPGYQLFAKADRGEVDVSRCLPCYVHGDEGTYYKRSGIMILQLQSLFGKGTSLLGRQAFADRLVGEGAANPYVNQRGVTLTTRFLLGVLPKESCDVTVNIVLCSCVIWACTG